MLLCFSSSNTKYFLEMLFYLTFVLGIALVLVYFTHNLNNLGLFETDLVLKLRHLTMPMWRCLDLVQYRL